MKHKFLRELFLAGTPFLMVLNGCQTTDGNTEKPTSSNVLKRTEPNTPLKRSVTVMPKPAPSAPRADNHEPTAGYALANVQAQLKIDVDEKTKEVNVIRDNADPFVITKPYTLKHADPYALRSYLEAAVGAKSINDSPAQVTSVKFTDGTGVVLVSAEEYRFADSEAGRGIDSIVEALDKEGLNYLPDADIHIYFPRISRAATLRAMLLKVGSSELDPEFTVAPGAVMVDSELNALVVKASQWNWQEMLAMLRRYDRPIPEVKLTYRVLEIYAENDDRIGVDFQSWKNNDGVDLFSAGTVARRNWGTFFTSGVDDTGFNRTSYWHFNPKWNTRYLDYMTSIGKAKCLAEGELVLQNRQTSAIRVESGFFYDRTYYLNGATSIPEATSEFVYTEPNPDTIPRESTAAIMPYTTLKDAYTEMGMQPGSYYLTKAGYTLRMMNTQVNSPLIYDAIAKITGSDASTSAISKYLTGFVKADGTVVTSAYQKTDWNTVDTAPGLIHGWLQYPMVTDGFLFSLQVTPVVTGRAASMKFDLTGISLLGWNSDGSARTSKSETSTTMQLAYRDQDFVIGGLRKSESVRGTTGLPFFKDIPVLGRLFSTESESIKQSQLVLMAHVEYSLPTAPVEPEIRENLGKIVHGVNEGMTTRVGNMFFQQYYLDDDREARIERLDSVGKTISDEYEAIR